MGLQQSTFALFGLGLAPIIATQLLRVVPSWRYVFMVVAIPGFILAIFMFIVLRDPRHITSKEPKAPGHKWSKIFHQRNIVVSMFGLFCAMTCVFVLSGLMPNYLTDYLHLPTEQMGVVTSALGFGGFVGQFALPGLSDVLGRKIVANLRLRRDGGNAVGFSSPWARIRRCCLGCCLWSRSFCLGLASLLTGPIAAETAPVGLVSSAVGIVVGAGEILGGGVAPSLAGFIAQHYGIQKILYLALAGATAGVLVCFFLKETAPRKVGVPVPSLVTSS